LRWFEFQCGHMLPEILLVSHRCCFYLMSTYSAKLGLPVLLKPEMIAANPLILVPRTLLLTPV